MLKVSLGEHILHGQSMFGVSLISILYIPGYILYRRSDTGAQAKFFIDKAWLTLLHLLYICFRSNSGVQVLHG